MLSRDELNDGIIFILKLQDAAGIPIQWVEKLRGAVAKRWYDIYQRSDWAALRIEAAEAFGNSVTEDEAEQTRRRGRCIVIRTQAVKAGELAPPRVAPKTSLLSPADVRRENGSKLQEVPAPVEFVIRGF